MSASELKYSIFQLVDSINDESRLKAIYVQLTAAGSLNGDWNENLSSELKEKIRIAQAEVREGMGISHVEVSERISKLIKAKKSA